MGSGVAPKDPVSPPQVPVSPEASLLAERRQYEVACGPCRAHL